MSALLLIPWFRLGPVAFSVGGHEVSLYPFQIGVGIAFVVIMTVAVIFARRHGRSVEQTLELAVMGALFALPFALVGFELQHQPETLFRVLREPSRFDELRFRWSSYGGMVGGFLGAMIWRWRSKSSLIEVGESLVFALPFGLFFARLGCFSVHDHPGRVSNFFLAVADFPVGAPPFEPRHDLGLYEALLAGVVAVVLIFLARTPRKPGFYIALVLILSPGLRFFLDFLRAAPEVGGDPRYFGLTLGQYVAPPLVAVGAALAVYVSRSDAEPS